MNDRLLTVGQVADIIGCGQSTVWRLLSKGQLPQPKRIGGMTRWLEADLYTFIRDSSVSKVERKTDQTSQAKRNRVKRRLSPRKKMSHS